MERLTGAVIGCAMTVHRELGPGFLESVYENALSHELTSKKISHQNQVPIGVYYRNQKVGEFIADILVRDCLILELKAIRQLSPQHEVQLVNYLTATRIETGLLFNFGTPSLQFKKKFLTYRPPQENLS
jgi:GxxExxY protein